ncbi:hypothetical protein [Halocatena marina]|uniref:Transposase n=1 Tax=Halocatena marina TaxID=2934937 RepID=A0ABD5YLY6_9EURY|nr:hypothetical protein [Halocatena marina]
MTSKKSRVILSIKRSYCLDCGWTASTELHSRRELSTLAIEHAVEHDHDIDSEIICNLSSIRPTIEHPDEAMLN